MNSNSGIFNSNNSSGGSSGGNSGRGKSGELRVNGEVRAQKVRVISADGDSLGILSRREALEVASQAGLDLVEVSPHTDPPVCKLLNYGRYVYEQKKKRSEAKKKQKIVEIKEIQMRPNIDTNDFDVKCRAMERFLNAKDKVKIVVRFRGREIAHKGLAYDLLDKIKEKFIDLAKVESQAKFEGKRVTMVIGPK